MRRDRCDIRWQKPLANRVTPTRKDDHSFGRVRPKLPLLDVGMRLDGLSLDAEGHEATIIDRPCRVPSDLPCIAIWIGDIAAKAAMGWRVGLAQKRSSRPDETLHDQVDISLVGNVVSEGERPGSRLARTLYILVKTRICPSSQHEAVHLVEGDIVVLEDRSPTEAVGIELPRSCKRSNAESDDRNLLLHVPSPMVRPSVVASDVRGLGPSP